MYFFDDLLLGLSLDLFKDDKESGSNVRRQNSQRNIHLSGGGYATLKDSTASPQVFLGFHLPSSKLALAYDE